MTGWEVVLKRCQESPSLNSSFYLSGKVSGKKNKRGKKKNNSVPFPQWAMVPPKHQQKASVQTQDHVERSGSEAGGVLSFLLSQKSQVQHVSVAGPMLLHSSQQQ